MTADRKSDKTWLIWLFLSLQLSDLGDRGGYNPIFAKVTTFEI